MAVRRRRSRGRQWAQAVYLNVLRIPGGNVLDIVAAVKKTIAGLTNLPSG